MSTCPATGRNFETSEMEMTLRKKLGVEGEPEFHPAFRFQLLGAFWQHWNLHKRACGKTGKQIISVYPNECPYPVWHKDEWVQHANPPGADFVVGESAFKQMWDLFIQCPIPHNMGTDCENCEYTDDYWHSKNCYLSHSGYKNEDIRYCYRTFETKNCQFCVFSDTSERCADLINCKGCFQVRFAYNSWNCRDSAFLYDCRNCSDCFLCCNLRNKQYCFQNEQLSKEDYEKKMSEWDLKSRKTYDAAKQAFSEMMLEKAWHKALFIEKSENVTGNYIENSKNCENMYFVTHEMQDCINLLRSGQCKDCLDTVGPSFETELVFYSINTQDHCYDVRYCDNMIQCKWMEYSAHCFQCEHCFGCAGLVGKKYYIFNKPYEPEEYEKKKAEIIASMKQTGEYGKFFPGSFASVPYDESYSAFYWPLSEEEIQRLGFRQRRMQPETPKYADATKVPDRSDAASPNLPQTAFLDPLANRPFQIQPPDIDFAKSLGIPLPNCFYATRLKENFRWIPFNGETRTAQCAKCSVETQTSWPEEYNERILCQKCYLETVY